MHVLYSLIQPATWIETVHWSKFNFYGENRGEEKGEREGEGRRGRRGEERGGEGKENRGRAEKISR